ncbi:MAG: hypothetical protein ACRC4N_02400 [Gammaproteobacteria bacterium]
MNPRSCDPQYNTRTVCVCVCVCVWDWEENPLCKSYSSTCCS